MQPAAKYVKFITSIWASQTSPFFWRFSAQAGKQIVFWPGRGLPTGQDKTLVAEEQSSHFFRDRRGKGLGQLGFWIKLKLRLVAAQRLEFHWLPGENVDGGGDRLIRHAAKPQLLAAN